MKLRLDKYLADMGFGTRTEVKTLLKKGYVTWNGNVIKKPEVKVDTEKDAISCHGQVVRYVEFVYFLLNKPAGVLTATRDKKQKTVLDLLDFSVRKDVFPVGRLDKDTEGLLLITNDGNLAHKLLSPKKHVKKRYFAVVEGVMAEEDVRLFQEGLEVPAYRFLKNTDDIAYEDNNMKEERFAAFRAMPAHLQILSVNRDKNQSEVEIEICEGKFHQIKRMCEAVGKPVLFLKRISMGNLRLDDCLKPGEYRKLTEEEISHVI